MQPGDSFQHFVITPYFVRFNANTTDRDAKLRAAPDWLENRFHLFTKFCLPSVSAQSNKNFRWLIYFDRDVPAEYMDRIRTVTSEFTNITIIECDLFNREFIEESVKQFLMRETKWVLTTRLDNDDGWHREFVSILQGNLNFERQFFNYPVGLLFFSDKIYLYRHSSNAFISFLEPTDHFLTAWCGPHPFLDRIAPVRQLPAFPAFLQVIHGQTRSNKPRGVRVHRMLALQGFEAMLQLFDMPPVETDLAVVLDNLNSSARWAARDKAVSMIRRGARMFIRPGAANTRVGRLLKRVTGD